MWWLNISVTMADKGFWGFGTGLILYLINMHIPISLVNALILYSTYCMLNFFPFENENVNNFLSIFARISMFKYFRDD
jgi:hypothetical protein